MIPLVDLEARHRRHAADIEEQVLTLLRSGRYIGGPEVRTVEGELAGAFGLAHGVGVASGTDALMLALQALGIKPGARVAVPALSFFATAEAVLQLGAVPVFVDVLAHRPLMDPALVPLDVDAVITVPLFGMGGHAPRCQAPVICDAAQAIGWGWGKPPGILSCLSLYPTKTVGAAGDGGAVLTDDAELASRTRSLGNHGLSEPHRHQSLGRNSRLDALQAVVVRAQLRTLSQRVARRREIAARYEQALGTPVPRDPRDAVHHFVLRSKDREGLMARLQEAGVACAVYYPAPMSAQPALGEGDWAACPVATRWSREMLAIPCHEDLSEAQVGQIAELLVHA